MIKKTATLALVALVFLFAGCQGAKEATPTPIVPSGYVPVVSVTGELVPQKWAAVSPKQGGIVREVLVEPSDEVQEGQTLLILDDTDLQISLRVANEQVAAQQAALDRLLAGSSEQVIARADRENAQQIASAEVALRIAERQVAQARVQDPADDVAIARAQIDRLEIQRAQARAQDPAAEVVLAQIELERAKIALDDTQNEYNKALDRPWEDQEIRDGWAKQLEQVQLNYRAAQARLDGALRARSAHAVGLQVLDAQIGESQIALSKALDAQTAYSMTLGTLADQVEAAKLDLQHLRAWENPFRDKPTAPEIAQAQALLDQARESARQIEQQIAETVVRSPLSGAVGMVSARAGELVSPGQSLVTVGDLGTLRVETTDLDEIDIVRVTLEQDVVVTFDALPDRVFEGRVTRISPMAEPGSGGVNYTVVIEIEDMNPVLRWGMTAFVDIETE